MTRPYLRSGDRRRQLLTAAMAVIDSRGLEGLTIANVAVEAGVTRQLVYGHFDDVNALLLALLEDRFGADRADPGQVPAGERPPGLARSMALRAMSRPAADRRLLRSVLAASDERRPELTRLIAALRTGIIDRWIRLAPDGKTDATARAWVWAVFNAQFGLWDLVDGGEIDPEQAAGILIGLITEHFAAQRHDGDAEDPSADALRRPDLT
jgi:AcrR family transcriptional regulator